MRSDDATKMGGGHLGAARELALEILRNAEAGRVSAAQEEARRDACADCAELRARLATLAAEVERVKKRIQDDMVPRSFVPTAKVLARADALREIREKVENLPRHSVVDAGGDEYDNGSFDMWKCGEVLALLDATRGET